LAEGETATLSLARKGYKAKTVVVAGEEPKEVYVLEPLALAAKPSPGVAKPAAVPLGGIDDIGDPFAKK
jgi:hypothetical protein